MKYLTKIEIEFQNIHRFFTYTYFNRIVISITKGEEIGMVNGFVPWTKTTDPLACNTDDPVNFIQVSRDPFRTPFQWSSGKNAGDKRGIYLTKFF